MGSDSCEGMTLQSNWDIGSLASTTSMGYKRTGDLIIFVDYFGIWVRFYNIYLHLMKGKKETADDQNENLFPQLLSLYKRRCDQSGIIINLTLK